MKKSIIFCLCIAVVALFAACKDPDGVYNPSKKIQKVFTVNDNGEKVLAEAWQWDGDVLTSISYYDYDGTLASTNHFSYDSQNRLIAMDQNGAHGEYIYDGKKIDKIVMTADGVEVATYEFEHKGNKISEIDIDIDLFDDWGDDDFGWDKKDIVFPLRLMMPEICPAVETAVKKCSKDSKGDQVKIMLKWNGDNVKSMDVIFNMLGANLTETAEFTYDNKNNPMYGSLATMSSSAAENLFLNKNNPQTVKISYLGQILGTSDFTYEYDGNYPVKVTCKTVEDGMTNVATTIYEY